MQPICIFLMQVELADVACRRRELVQGIRSVKSRNATLKREIVFLEDLVKEMRRHQIPGIGYEAELKTNTGVDGAASQSTTDASAYVGANEKRCPHAAKSACRVPQDTQARRQAALDATIARLEEEVSCRVVFCTDSRSMWKQQAT